jgi:BON domain-containing protein
MKSKKLLVAVFLAAASVFAVGQSTSQNATASPSNDQGSSAYGNNTYNAGGHDGESAASNGSPTQQDTAIGPGGGGNTNMTSGSPNASHTSTPRAESLGGNNTSTNPSTINPGNGNSPSSAPPGSSGSNTGNAAPQRISTDGQSTAPGRLLMTGYEQQSQSSGQSAQSPSANATPSTATPAAPSPDANDNAGLQSRINDALRNEPTLNASHVVANVTDTGIELTGTVGSAKDKQTAERIASSFDGNRKLTDNISVTGAGHSDLAPNHPAMNNGGTGNAQNPSMENGTNPKK